MSTPKHPTQRPGRSSQRIKHRSPSGQFKRPGAADPDAIAPPTSAYPRMSGPPEAMIEQPADPGAPGAGYGPNPGQLAELLDQGGPEDGD